MICDCLLLRLAFLVSIELAHFHFRADLAVFDCKPTKGDVFSQARRSHGTGHLTDLSPLYMYIIPIGGDFFSRELQSDQLAMWIRLASQ